jgi:hypothetical protein
MLGEAGDPIPSRTCCACSISVILIDPAEQAACVQGRDASLGLQQPLPNEQLEIRR